MSRSRIAQYLPPPGPRSVAIEAAYREYLDRVQAGEAVDADAYCDQFPAFRHSLRELIDATVGLNDYAVATCPNIGDTVAGYRLVRALGRGGFGTVYLAQQVDVGDRLVVVKLSTESRHEAAVLGRLNHPNVVPVWDAAHDAGGRYSVTVMPYLGVATLADWLPRLDHGRAIPATNVDLIAQVAKDAPPGPSPKRVAEVRPYEQAVARIGMAIAGALDATHTANYVHGDLKPANILLGFDAEPYLIDYNLVSECGARQRLAGTIPYMPPETLLAVNEGGQPATGLPTEDVYALGVVLYELLTGRHPYGRAADATFDRRDAAEQLLELQKAGPPDPRTLNPRVDAQFARLVMRCMAWDPADRPASAGAVAARLEQQFARPRRLMAWVRRNARAVAAVAFLVAAGAAPVVQGVASRVGSAAADEAAGRAALLRADYPAAVAAFDASLARDATRRTARLGRATALARQEHYGEARLEFERCDPADHDAVIQAWRAYCAVGADDYETATVLGERLAKQADCPAAAMNNLAVAYRNNGVEAAAKRWLAAAVVAAPALAVARLNRAVPEVEAAVESERPASDQCMADLQLAAAARPSDATTAYTHALALATAAKGDQVKHGPALRQTLTRCLHAGLTLDRLGQEPLFVPWLAGLAAADTPVPPQPRCRITTYLAEPAFPF